MSRHETYTDDEKPGVLEEGYMGASHPPALVSALGVVHHTNQDI